MSLTKQEKLGTANFILTILSIISVKYLFLFVPDMPTTADAEGQLIFSIVTIIAVLIIHAITWVLLLRYFSIEKKNKTKLIVYEILFLISIAALYAETKYEIFPEVIAENLLTGIGIFIILQMLLSILLTFIISKIRIQ